MEAVALLSPYCLRRDSVAAAPSALPLSLSFGYAELVSNGSLPLSEAVGWPRPPEATGSPAVASTAIISVGHRYFYRVLVW